MFPGTDWRFIQQIDSVHNTIVYNCCIQWSRQILFFFFKFFFPTINNKELGQIIHESSSGFQNTLFFYLQKYKLFLELDKWNTEFKGSVVWLSMSYLIPMGPHSNSSGVPGLFIVLILQLWLIHIYSFKIWNTATKTHYWFLWTPRSSAVLPLP